MKNGKRKKKKVEKNKEKGEGGIEAIIKELKDLK